ncbi:uncharacterized protein TNCV_1065631 [Trichonephila clavipes]|nr:uncharacterized protein TNCV_1065631 [Trichonephila clavipes]
MDVCMYDFVSLQHRSTDHNENCHVDVFLWGKKGVEENCFSGYLLYCTYPPGGATAYQLLHRSINRQVSNRVAKNDAHLALSPTFRYVSIESPL